MTPPASPRDDRPPEPSDRLGEVADAAARAFRLLPAVPRDTASPAPRAGSAPTPTRSNAT